MTDTNSPSIIALTGYAGAGKDRFARMLTEQLTARGLKVATVSSGDLIRQYVREHRLGDPGDRGLLQRTVDEVAKTHGYTYWLEQSIAQVQATGTEVLLYPGLRQAVEAERLHQRGDTIIALEVPVETRYQWAKLRARPGDDISLEQFKANEEAERSGTAQQIDAVFAAADVVVANDGTLEQLEAVAAAIAANYPSHLAKCYSAQEAAV